LHWWRGLAAFLALLGAGPAMAASTITGALLDGAVYSAGSPYYVRPGQVISVTLYVTEAGGGNWKSNGALFGYGTYIVGTNCQDNAGGVTPPDGNYVVTFSSTVNPAATGTLDAILHTFTNVSCGGTGDLLTWTGARVVDSVPATVTSIVRADTSPTGAATVSWTVTFSEGVTGVDASDFSLVPGGGVTGAAITSVTGSGTTWTVTASTGSGNGTLGLNLVDDDSIRELADNPLAGTGVFNVKLTCEFYTIDRLSAFDVVDVGAAKATNIYTKVAGVSFSLDLLALDSTNAINPGYNGTASVKLVNGATGGGVCTSMTELQDYGSVTFDTGTGRKTVSLTYNSAVANARIKVSDAAAGVTTCSPDSFAIRPDSFSISSTNANADSAGASTSATPAIKAGANFSLTTTAVVGYGGTPSINTAQISAHSGAVQTGTLAGSFGAANTATGEASGASFTYSEVGYFRLETDAVYDDTFTAIDQPNDCTNDFSNTPAGGKYGCKFGNDAQTVYFGRFIPDHFIYAPGTLTNRRLLSCTPASAFTYAGEQLQVSFDLTAQNSSNATTQNYTTASGFARLTGTAIASFGFGAIDLADAVAPTNATALSGSLGLVSSSGTWSNGSGTFTANLGLTRAASPDGPYESFNLGIDPQDADGVKLGAYNLDTSVPSDGNDHALVGTTQIRYGRLRLANANGSELLDLRIPIQTQYWNGSMFATHGDDSCTSLSSPSIGLGNYKSNLSSGETGANPATIDFTSGVGNLRLTKPGIGNSGSVDVCVDLGADPAGGTSCSATGAGMSYLQGKWPPGTAWDNDPVVRATFGVFRNANEFIYLREMY
jgi:hypothetical protein